MEGLPDDSGSNAPSIGASQIREFPGSEAEQALTHDVSTREFTCDFIGHPDTNLLVL